MEDLFIEAFIFFIFIKKFILFYIFYIVMDIVIQWNETAIGLHVLPILNPPPRNE